MLVDVVPARYARITISTQNPGTDPNFDTVLVAFSGTVDDAGAPFTEIDDPAVAHTPFTEVDAAQPLTMRRKCINSHATDGSLGLDRAASARW